jgi:septum site-determining protein MinD
MGKAFLVTSGKGGTGKTTVTAGLSVVLAAMGKSVVCIDADVGLRGLDLAVGMPECTALDFQDVMNGNASLTDALYAHPRLPTLHLLNAPVTVLGGRLSQTQFNKMVAEIKESFDFCFVDCAAGLSAGFTLVADSCDYAILVSMLELTALRGVQKVAEALTKHGNYQSWLLVNRVNARTVCRYGSVNIDDAMDMTGLPLIGVVPEDSDALKASLSGIPLAMYGQTYAGEALRNIAQRLAGRHVPINEDLLRKRHRN